MSKKQAQEQDELVHSLDEIADAIVEMSKLGEKLSASKLNRRALVLLIQNAVGNVGGRGRIRKLPQCDIEAVLDALPTLKDHYLKEVEDRRGN